MVWKTLLLVAVAVAFVSARREACAQGPSLEHTPRPAVPVTIGGDQYLDACAGKGVITGLDPRGDGFLAVKAGPGPRYKRVDKLFNGEQVYLCSDHGKWFGVVYSKTKQKCNVTTPWAKPLPYTGPCRSGWIHKSYVKITAG